VTGGLRRTPDPAFTSFVVTDIRTVRTFVFSSSDDPDFDKEVRRRMTADGVGSYLHFVAMSDTSEDFNVWAVLDCSSREQARRFARRYFGSVVAYGVIPGRLGLKYV
jgi:hypothetical protein